MGSARGPLDTRAEELARELQNLKMEFARFWEGVCAQAKNPASNKEERTEITERTKASSSAFDVRDRATKADEEDLPSDYQTFKRLYPAAHFDEDKAKPAFQKLKKAERQQVIARLVELFLACERWLDEDGRYVPLASNWLNGKWSCDPPPALKKRSSKREDQEAEYARGREILRQAEEAERAAKGAGK